jgi:glycosyltransferase involved in cell wall biosynthesis
MERGILFVDQYADIGGGQRSLLALLCIARKAGLSSALIAPGGGLLQKTVEQSTDGSVMFHPLPEARMAKGKKGLRDVFGLVVYTVHLLTLLMQSRGFGVRYYNGPRAFPAGLIMSHLLAGCSIYHVRVDYSKWEKYILWLIVRFSRNSTIVFNSPYLRDVYADFDPATADSPCITVVENCLYPPYGDLPFEDRFCIRNDRFKAAVFGRVCPDKGQDRLVAAVHACSSLDVLLVGKCESSDRAYLDRILADGGGRIAHLDFVEQLPMFVSEERIQISIVPSRWNEAFGLVAIESMAMSCLTLVSDRGMLPSIAGRTGAVLFKSRHELALKLRWLSTLSSEALTKIVCSQHRRVMEEFAYCNFARKVTCLIASETQVS